MVAAIFSDLCLYDSKLQSQTLSIKCNKCFIKCVKCFTEQIKQFIKCITLFIKRIKLCIERWFHNGLYSPPAAMRLHLLHCLAV